MPHTLSNTSLDKPPRTGDQMLGTSLLQNFIMSAAEKFGGVWLSTAYDRDCDPITIQIQTHWISWVNYILSAGNEWLFRLLRKKWDNASPQAAVKEIGRTRNPYGTTRLAWGVLGVMIIFWDLVATWTQWHTHDIKGSLLMLLLKTQNHKIIKIRDYTVEVISTPLPLWKSFRWFP